MKHLRITVKTIEASHLLQLPQEHFLNDENDWSKVHIHGRLCGDGFILVEDKVSHSLRKISPVVFIDAYVKTGGLMGAKQMEPKLFLHAQAAGAALQAIPQLFIS